MLPFRPVALHQFHHQICQPPVAKRSAFSYHPYLVPYFRLFPAFSCHKNRSPCLGEFLQTVFSHHPYFVPYFRRSPAFSCHKNATPVSANSCKPSFRTTRTSCRFFPSLLLFHAIKIAVPVSVNSCSPQVPPAGQPALRRAESGCAAPCSGCAGAPCGRPSLSGFASFLFYHISPPKKNHPFKKAQNLPLEKKVLRLCVISFFVYLFSA